MGTMKFFASKYCSEIIVNLKAAALLNNVVIFPSQLVAHAKLSITYTLARKGVS